MVQRSQRSREWAQSLGKVLPPARSLWTFGGALVALLFLGGALVPVFGVLFRERQLADQVRLLAEESVPARALDAQIRGMVQARARALRFYVAYEDVFVQYSPDKKQTFVLPERLGYTFSLRLPFFGIFEVPVLCVRTFDVKPAVLAPKP